MRPFRIGFVLDQVAGHVTTAKNLRRIVDDDPEIEPVWGEIHYWIESGTIERLHRGVLRWAPQHPLGVLRGVVEQHRVLAQGPFDALLTNTAVAHYRVGPLRDTPTMFDFDSTPIQLDQMEGYSDGTERGPVTAAKFKLIRRLFEAAALNQAWSEWARRSVIDDYGIDGDRVVVNPPGVDLSAWSPADRRLSGERPEAARVLFVGADFRRKGGLDLLDWYRGADPDRTQLDIVTREDVPDVPGVTVHSGLQPNSPELRALYDAADVFVLPSRGECFGIATIEAMASGIPVVVTDVGGTADIVEPGGNGYIVPAGAPAELGAAVMRIVDDPALAQGMAVRSRQLAETRFDLARNARRTLDRLKALADRGRTE